MSTPDIWPRYGCLHPMHDDDCKCGHGPVDGITRAQPCSRCRKSTLSIAELAVHGNAAAEAGVASGTVIMAAFMCRECQGVEAAKAAEMRQTFDGLLSDGMSRDLANRVMVAWHG